MFNWIIVLNRAAQPVYWRSSGGSRTWGLILVVCELSVQWTIPSPSNASFERLNRFCLWWRLQFLLGAYIGGDSQGHRDTVEHNRQSDSFRHTLHTAFAFASSPTRLWPIFRKQGRSVKALLDWGKSRGRLS